jgi:membrane-associated protein
MGIFDFILHIDVHLGELIVTYGKMTYAILFAIIFAETGFVFTPFLPGDSLLFAAGMFAATGSFNVILLATILWLATFLGDNINYWVGHYFGQKIINNKYFPVNQKHIDSTQEFYQKHGGKTVFLARFMPIIRTFAPFVAGIGKMQYRKFVSYSFLGGFTWVIGFVFVGYFFGNIPVIKNNFSAVIMGIIAISVFPGIIRLLKGKIK